MDGLMDEWMDRMMIDELMEDRWLDEEMDG
jgi:hypothetical protein